MKKLRKQNLLRGLGLLMVLSLLLSACGGAAPAAPAAEAPAAEAPAAEAPAAPSDEITRENTLVYAADATDLITLDPAVAYEFGGVQVSGNVYETLVSFTPGGAGELIPVLAETWDVAEDGDMWKLTFKLNPAAKSPRKTLCSHGVAPSTSTSRPRSC